MTKNLPTIAAIAMAALVSLPAFAQAPTASALPTGPAALEPLVIWQAATGAQIPQSAVPGGSLPGVPLALCAASYNGTRSPGKVVDGTCSFGYAGKEVASKQYDILLGNSALLAKNPLFIRWVPARQGQIPPGAFMGAREGAQVLPICRAAYTAVVMPGKLVGQNCKIAFRGQEVSVPQYEVLVVSRLGTEIPTATLSAVAANPALASAPASVPANAAPGGRRPSTASSGTSITVADVQGMNVESAMMAIQSQRAELLEPQLKGVFDAIIQRNAQIMTLNGQLPLLNQQFAALGDRLQQTPSQPPQNTARNAVMADMNRVQMQITGLKSQIDSLASSQQLDMLRLQSLINQRNESFDLTAYSNKILADSRARNNIPGNTR